VVWLEARFALAERTTKATREIGGMIKAIQVDTKSAVTAMESPYRFERIPPCGGLIIIWQVAGGHSRKL